ncbi:dynamin family protein [Streptomyces sp. NPDC004244]
MNSSAPAPGPTHRAATAPRPAAHPGSTAAAGAGTPGARFTAVLHEAARAVAGRHALEPVRHALAAAEARLAARMRLAVVGRVSQGKSTLVNALIGRRLAPTGRLELSYTVNHIRHGTPPSLTLHRRDGTSVPADLAELERYAVRAAEHREYLAAIDHLEVVCDSPHLAAFDLIDTAGLGSVWHEDSQRTLDFLRRSKDSVDEETAAATARADALMVVMSGRGMAGGDAELLARFLGPDAVLRSPVTAVGVLTKVETLWPHAPDPMAAARELLARTTAFAANRRLVFDTAPVCGLLAETAALLDGADLDALTTLAAVPAPRLDRALRNAVVFGGTDDDPLPLTAAERRALYRRFSGYGLHSAVRLIREGATTAAELRTALSALSGIDALRRTVTGHFGHRSEAVKIQGAVGAVCDTARGLRPTLDAEDRHAADAVDRLLTGFLAREPALGELDVLHRLATGTLRLGPEDREQVLALVGARGRDVHSRLGLPPDTPLDTARRRALDLAAAWLPRTAAGFPGGDRAAARLLHARCQNLLAHIDAARSHLEDPR